MHIRIPAAGLAAAALFPLAAYSASNARPSLAEPSLNPDASEIAFVSGGDIWTVPVRGGAAHLLVSHPANESRPLYSPDGKRIAFMSNRHGNDDVFVLDLATGDTRRITFDDASDHLDAWSRDGKWLYFSSAFSDIAGMNDVYRVSSEGAHPCSSQATGLPPSIGLRPRLPATRWRLRRRVSWLDSGGGMVTATSMNPRSGRSLSAQTGRNTSASAEAAPKTNGRCGVRTVSSCSSCRTAAARKTCG
jgi:dipeptidyl aminopeptidase/acylaminoacyl peptidase